MATVPSSKSLSHEERTAQEPRADKLHPVTLEAVKAVNDSVRLLRLKPKGAVEVGDDFVRELARRSAFGAETVFLYSWTNAFVASAVSLPLATASCDALT
ncbi:hypothetical protein LTR04_006129, partial [Oleoguttula sp. CCFEE 6159]